MDTRDVLLVDAFTDEPMAGTPVGVVRDAAALTDDQRSAIADEFGAPGTAFLSDDDGRYDVTVAGCGTAGPQVHVGVATTAALDERDAVDGGVTLETDWGPLETTVEDDTVWIDVPDPDLREVSVSEDDVADALGIDVASMRDVGADLPMGRSSLGPSYLLVPVNFFEHVSGIEPDPAAVADLLEAENADAIYAFTFDTLEGENDVHARTIHPGTTGASAQDDPQAAEGTGLGAACCGAHLRRHGTFDHDRDRLGFEEGDFRDRPTRIRVDLAENRIGGRSVTVLDGTVVVPPADEDDEIIEA